MNIGERGRAFLQGRRGLAGRTVWEWRRCPRVVGGGGGLRATGHRWAVGADAWGDEGGRAGTGGYRDRGDLAAGGGGRGRDGGGLGDAVPARGAGRAGPERTAWDRQRWG